MSTAVSRLSALFLLPSLLSAAALAVSLTDPSGEAVPDAEIRLQAVPGGVVRSIGSAAGGAVKIDDLAPGEYIVTISKQGFATVERRVELKDEEPVNIAIALTIAPRQTTVQVNGRASSAANSDPNYRLLRGGVPAGVYRVENLTLERDAGRFDFHSGEFSFLPPVMGRTVMAVFTGEGSFHLTPSIAVEANYLRFVTGAAEVDEPFRSAVLCFTDGSEAEIKRAGKSVDEPSKAGDAFMNSGAERGSAATDRAVWWRRCSALRIFRTWTRICWRNSTLPARVRSPHTFTGANIRICAS